MPFSPTRRQLVAAAAAMALPRPLWAHSDWTVPPEFEPYTVQLEDAYPPGAVLVDPDAFALYHMQTRHEARCYTVGIARGALYEGGLFTIGAKKEWPSWTPTQAMIDRDPDHYAKWSDGMPGGPDNPLGARALYLFRDDGSDSFLRIHGTPEPWTVGTEVSNGCVRLVNDHIIALYDAVDLGAPCLLYPRG